MPENKPVFDFEPFAETNEYLQVNRINVRGWITLMRKGKETSVPCLVDLATGTGTMASLFLSELPEEWGRPTVVCLDQSAEALEFAKKKLRASKNKRRLVLVQSSIEEMNLVSVGANVVIWGNGIHYVPEKKQREALERVKDVLLPRGWFFFNTTFYEEARPETTHNFYTYQVRHAVRLLKEKNVTRTEKTGRSVASNFLPKAHYTKLASDFFTDVIVVEVPVRVYRDAWEKISGFYQYAAGALHGYPVPEAAEALKEAVAPALQERGNYDEEGKLYVERNWLAIAARKG